MAFAVGALDDAIREYLLFRGFTQTLKLFETERRDDKDKGFSFRVRPRRASIRTPPGQLVCAHTHTQLQVNRIVEYIMQCVFKSDFPSLQSFWSHLYGRFFSQMNSESLTMAYRLETNVLRCSQTLSVTELASSVYVCVCLSFLTAGCFWCRPARQGDMRRCEPSLRRCQTPSTTARSGRTGLVSLSLSLFVHFSVCVCLARLCLSVAALPFTKNPDQHPTFRLYYSKEWLDTFQITLHNFFSTLFTSIHIPLPCPRFHLLYL